MATTIDHKQTRVGTAGEDVPRAALGDGGQPMVARLTTEQVWRQVAKASFAILSYVTPAGQPRSTVSCTGASVGGCMWRSHPTAGRRGTLRPVVGSR